MAGDKPKWSDVKVFSFGKFLLTPQGSSEHIPARLRFGRNRGRCGGVRSSGGRGGVKSAAIPTLCDLILWPDAERGPFPVKVGSGPRSISPSRTEIRFGRDRSG